MRVTDRGPFVVGRCPGLSLCAARAIGHTGVATVTIARIK
jgi:rare lipoprotein A (peptidoglycan hydrolase)